MKRGILFRLLFLLFPVLCLVSCSDSSSEPDYANAVVDPRLVGDWYAVKTTRTGSVYSDFYLTGFTIRADKSMRGLGIELATGKIQPLEEDYYYLGITEAKEGTISYRVLAPPGSIVKSYNYSFENNTLVLRGMADTLTFRKTSVGTSVMTGAVQSASYSMDSLSFSSLMVHNSLSATAVSMGSGRIRLSIMSYYKRMQIEIVDFSGPGTYQIDYKKTFSSSIATDVPNYQFADSTRPSWVTITQVDNHNKKLKGMFQFNIRSFNGTLLQYESRTVRNGTFDMYYFD